MVRKIVAAKPWHKEATFFVWSAGSGHTQANGIGGIAFGHEAVIVSEIQIRTCGYSINSRGDRGNVDADSVSTLDQDKVLEAIDTWFKCSGKDGVVVEEDLYV